MIIPSFDNTPKYAFLIEKGLKTSEYTTTIEDVCEFIIKEHSLLPHTLLTPRHLRIRIYEFLNELPIAFVDESNLNYELSYLTASMYVALNETSYNRVDNVKIFNNKIFYVFEKHVPFCPDKILMNCITTFITAIKNMRYCAIPFMSIPI